MTNEELSREIRRLQLVQQSQPNTRTPEWEAASEALAPLFEEAQERAKNGHKIYSL